ncbi:hypothetical protein BDM02DRAFT_3192055 [Thelephora ganbajun]|uniref:Uncharacterized protein n=1 Tax=Thelephora ganbajun TaxID=370292 RepID=A0ACB6Z142_THEGA|nr:hypothetical protein BDM02DRAFT_3192055 [Thelephora ganbajun]
METLSPGARGYRLLSVMRAVMMMPNSTVFTRLWSSDNIGGELQLIFPISQEEFDSLLAGEIEAEVRQVQELEVVWSGAQDVKDELEYSDGWVTDCSYPSVFGFGVKALGLSPGFKKTLLTNAPWIFANYTATGYGMFEHLMHRSLDMLCAVFSPTIICSLDEARTRVSKARVTLAPLVTSRDRLVESYVQTRAQLQAQLESANPDAADKVRATLEVLHTNHLSSLLEAQKEIDKALRSTQVEVSWDQKMHDALNEKRASERKPRFPDFHLTEFCTANTLDIIETISVSCLPTFQDIFSEEKWDKYVEMLSSALQSYASNSPFVDNASSTSIQGAAAKAYIAMSRVPGRDWHLPLPTNITIRNFSESILDLDLALSEVTEHLSQQLTHWFEGAPVMAMNTSLSIARSVTELIRRAVNAQVTGLPFGTFRGQISLEAKSITDQIFRYLLRHMKEVATLNDLLLEASSTVGGKGEDTATKSGKKSVDHKFWREESRRVVSHWSLDPGINDLIQFLKKGYTDPGDSGTYSAAKGKSRVEEGFAAMAAAALEYSDPDALALWKALLSQKDVGRLRLGLSTLLPVSLHRDASFGLEKWVWWDGFEVPATFDERKLKEWATMASLMRKRRETEERALAQFMVELETHKLIVHNPTDSFPKSVCDKGTAQAIEQLIKASLFPEVCVANKLDRHRHACFGDSQPSLEESSSQMRCPKLKIKNPCPLTKEIVGGAVPSVEVTRKRRETGATRSDFPQSLYPPTPEALIPGLLTVESPIPGKNGRCAGTTGECPSAAFPEVPQAESDEDEPIDPSSVSATEPEALTEDTDMDTGLDLGPQTIKPSRPSTPALSVQEAIRRTSLVTLLDDGQSMPRSAPPSPPQLTKSTNSNTTLEISSGIHRPGTQDDPPTQNTISDTNDPPVQETHQDTRDAGGDAAYGAPPTQRRYNTR